MPNATENAFLFHVKRAFLQAAIYKTACEVQPHLPNIFDFGWSKLDNNVIPIMMSKPPKPENMHLNSFCSCKMYTCTSRCRCLTISAKVKCGISCLCEGKCSKEC